MWMFLALVGNRNGIRPHYPSWNYFSFTPLPSLPSSLLSQKDVVGRFKPDYGVGESSGNFLIQVSLEGWPCVYFVCFENEQITWAFYMINNNVKWLVKMLNDSQRTTSTVSQHFMHITSYVCAPLRAPSAQAQCVGPLRVHRSGMAQCCAAAVTHMYTHTYTYMLTAYGVYVVHYPTLLKWTSRSQADQAIERDNGVQD